MHSSSEFPSPGSGIPPLTCPACLRQIVRYNSRNPICERCGTEISIAASYPRKLWQITFGVLWVIGLVTFSSSARGSCFLWMFTFAIVLRVALMFVVPPWFELGIRSPKISFTGMLGVKGNARFFSELWHRRNGFHAHSATFQNFPSKGRRRIGNRTGDLLHTGLRS
jgi:hypothetical protein